MQVPMEMKRMKKKKEGEDVHQGLAHEEEEEEEEEKKDPRLKKFLKNR